ncbi:juvenile hormone acid O-methyltransferase-like isoform X2 [Planococcus citri]|uniref:juvenile hormone acid O-methyltransferase-like isoform X2 n=1 Tax=Planococcus citri TaxID=170843 RepID=UPI0031F7970C
MNEAVVYHENHDMQKTAVRSTLFRHLPEMQLDKKKNLKILDMGCGPGDLTLELLNLIPNTEKMVGIDKSDAMIDFANTHYQCKDERLHFKKEDIYCVDTKYSQFDAVFSFFVLQWVNQRKAVTNIYNVLKPGGQVLLLFISDSPNYELISQLALTRKWSPYLKDYSPKRFNDETPDIAIIMEQLGFNITTCLNENKSHAFSKEKYYEWTKALISPINPFLQDIPRCQLEDFEEDLKKIIPENKNICFNNSKNEVTFNFRTLTIIANKI